MGETICIPVHRQGIRINGPTVTISLVSAAPVGTLAWYRIKPIQRAWNISTGSVLIKRR